MQKATAAGMLKAEQAAARIGVCAATILRWLKSGKLTPYRFNQRVIRIKYSDLEKFVEEQKA